jgi:predicted nucleotidyltransferase
MVRLSRKLKKIKLTSGQLQNIVGYIKQQEDILALYLYGSYGTEYQTVFSDVDFAVLPMRFSPLDHEREIELNAELIQLGKNDDINLVNLSRVPVTLQMQVLETGRLLYCKDELLLADFKESVIRRYCDFEPDLRNIYQDFDAGLREEFI